jgi:hypothetical protein
MLTGVSATSSWLARSSTLAGATSRGASARRIEWMLAITNAAGTPLSLTSPTTTPTWPSGSSIRS